MTTIYCLSDPRTAEVCYVGQTNMVPPQRRHYGGYKDRGACAAWRRSLRSVGFRPIFTVIEEVPEEEGDAAERSWISMYRAAGCRLLNQSEGGRSGPGSAGLPGTHKSAEHKERIRASLQGHTFTDEHRARLSASSRWRKP